MPLKRQLGLGAAIAAVCGESIALGIFVTPASMAKSLGSPLLLLAVWSAMALMAGAGALCYARLAVAMPEAGGARKGEPLPRRHGGIADRAMWTPLKQNARQWGTRGCEGC
jgi:hypothetical protein